MFIEGIVGVCQHGREVHVDKDVIQALALDDGTVFYGTAHGCTLTVPSSVHRHAARWLRAKATKDLAEPSDEELQLIDFEFVLDGIRTPSDLEALWVK